MTKILVGLAVMAVLLLIFFRYAWPKLKEMMEKRQEQIRIALESADSAKKDAASAEDERQLALEKGREQAAEIVAQARRNAEQINAESATRAEAEYDRIVAAANVEVVLARQRAIDDAADRLGDVVMEVVEQVIEREVSEADHEALVRQAVGALDATAPVESSGGAR